MKNINERTVIAITFPGGYDVCSLPLTLEEMIIAVPVINLQQRLLQASRKKIYESVRADGLYEGCACCVLPNIENAFLVHEETGDYISPKLICYISSVIRQANALPNKAEKIN